MSGVTKRLLVPVLCVAFVAFLYVGFTRSLAATDVVGEAVAGHVWVAALAAGGVLLRLFLILAAPAWILYSVVMGWAERG